MKVGTKLAVLMGGIYVVASVLLVLFVNHAIKQDALSHADEISQVLLKRNLASHTYLNTHLKPKIFDLIKSVKSQDYFDPIWMSSTYAIREIDNIFKATTGLIPICSRCKKIRDEMGYWQQLEAYISEHSDVLFSHGICEDCMKILYPDIAKRILEDRGKSS